ncbi:MAG: 2Fe-2S iron-sulfur cluster binding domain-containing protein [Bauldia sp.]|nr:2Fe-2S iron-sulfur cluster binding domain-containing protein [Bauldia sp.]
MVELTFEGVEVHAAEGQTVLSALEDAGIPLDCACRAGICQSCLVQSLDAPPPPAAQAGLPRAMAMDGYFMACVCVPEGPLTIGRAGKARQRLDVTVRAVERLSPTVVRLLLDDGGRFQCHPGQFLTLIHPASGVTRSYSIAGNADGALELHLRILPEGRMSRLVADDLSPDDVMTIAGPSGSCFYDPADRDQRIVLAGTGTGLAPLWGILQDALRHGHRGPISLYHGALDRSGLYLVEALESLEAERPGFRYVPCLRDAEDPAGGDLWAVVSELETDLRATTFFLCGDELLIRRMKRGLFMAGARLDQIHADPFTPAQARAAS